MLSFAEVNPLFETEEEELRYIKAALEFVREKRTAAKHGAVMRMRLEGCPWLVDAEKEYNKTHSKKVGEESATKK